jgi:hypothetical protein
MEVFVMQSTLYRLLLVLALFGIALNPCYGQTKRPGNEVYSPTKLEWAALELQAMHGTSVMDPQGIYFIAKGDGETVVCILTYDSDFKAFQLKSLRDSIQKGFEKYRQSRQWPWLRLEFQEKPLSMP